MNEIVLYNIVLCSGDPDYCVDAQKAILLIWNLCVGVKEHVHMVQRCTVYFLWTICGGKVILCRVKNYIPVACR